MARFLAIALLLGPLAACGSAAPSGPGDDALDLIRTDAVDVADAAPDGPDLPGDRFEDGADDAADLPPGDLPGEAGPDALDVPPDAVDVEPDVAPDLDVPDGPDTPGDLADDGPVPDAPDVPPPPACLESPSLCDDGNACSQDVCDPVLGCLHTPLSGSGCDDANACTLGDTCESGACIPGTPLSCADSDPCTDDLCDPVAGCLHPWNAAPCDDGNACTRDDTCDRGACAGTPMPIDCACQQASDCQLFENGNPCDGTMICADHVCVVDPATVVACDTSKDPACRRTACDPASGQCVPKPLPDNTTCDDASLCTTGDRCLQGACVGGAPPSCDDGNRCTDDSCAAASGCLHAFNTAPCAAARCEGNVHYAAATCSAGSCPAQVATDCTGTVACIADTCTPAGGCAHALRPGACLIGGTCRAEGETNPANPCQACLPAGSLFGWSPVPDGASCGTGQACLAGTCRGPIITEFMASNHDTIKDEDGDSSDWIEIYNPSGVGLSLAGWHLTDDPAKPAKWTFPAVTLPSNAYLVVFASDKDRTDPAGELHLNFKLTANGEYLALVRPDLQAAQSFVSFPPQATDVSYGAAVQVASQTFVGSGAAVRYRVPSGANPPADWDLASFDDSGADWTSGITALGFDVTQVHVAPPAGEGLGVPIADSVADWSVAGIQGANGWTYGYYNRTLDPDRTYSAEEFVPFPRDGLGFSPTDFWTGTVYDWYAGNPPWTSIGQESVHPAGENNGAEHWPIRRYLAEADGLLAVQWTLERGSTAGDGVTGYVFHRGVLVDAASIAGSDTVGESRMLVLPDVRVGDPIDIALGPTGPGGQPQDWSDQSFQTAAMWLLPDLGKQVGTDAGTAMASVASSLYARLVFDISGPGAFNRLWLRMKYDDGFVATLNGTPLASANAPAAPAWDSTATVKRSVSAAITFATFDVRDRVSLLVPGDNVLGLHGLNSAVDDPTFLLLPELEGRIVTYDAGAGRYYGRPTPGADNDPSLGDAGPVVEHLTPQGGVAPGQDVVVTARAFSTGPAITGATLLYRVMFGPEVPVAMTLGVGGVWTGTIPGGVAAAGQMIRWAVVVDDAGGHGTRVPAFLDPLDSEQYFGTVVADETIVSNLPVIHWFAEVPSAAETRTGTRCQVFFDGEFYDNVRFDLHGQSTSGPAFPKKSFNVDFNSDHRFRLSSDTRRMKDVNLLTNYADKSKLRNTLAYESFRDAGAGHHLAFPVRVQRNGTFFSVHDFVEDGDDRWLERLGLDPEGALYKQYDGLYDAAMGEKKTRKDEDHSDLAAFIAGLDRAGDALRNYLYDHVNIPAMADFYAGLTLTADMDCCHKNFYVYRDTNGNGEWRYMPWDVDLTFGRNWIKTLNYFDDTMHPQNGLFGGGGNKLTAVLYALPEFQQMYLRRLRTLMDSIQQSPATPADQLRFEKRIDELVARIGSDGALDYAAWPMWGLDQTMEQAAEILKSEYMAPRRVFLFETQTVSAGGPIPEAQDAPIVLFGDVDPSPGNPAEAYVTLVNPNDVAVDLSGWTVTGDLSLTLQPGTVLPASGTIYLSPDVVAFRARAVPPTGGQGLLVQGNYSGVFDRVEGLVLLDAAGVPVP